MKELDRTKRISIVAVLSILLIVIALLNYKKPSQLYRQNTMLTLSQLDTTDYLISPDELEASSFSVVDIRNPIEFEKGHLPGAVNIYTPELLEKTAWDQLNEFSESGTILLYGANPKETLPAFMLLCQLGIGPVKILESENYMEENQMKMHYSQVEKETDDIAGFIEMSVKTTAEKNKEAMKKSLPPPPKKVVPKKKKKKKMPEGGC